jgi:predicted acyltransferase
LSAIKGIFQEVQKEKVLKTWRLIRKVLEIFLVELLLAFFLNLRCVCVFLKKLGSFQHENG